MSRKSVNGYRRWQEAKRKQIAAGAIVPHPLTEAFYEQAKKSFGAMLQEILDEEEVKAKERRAERTKSSLATMAGVDFDG